MRELGYCDMIKNILLGFLTLSILITIPNIIFYSNQEVIDVNPAFAWSMLIFNVILLITAIVLGIIVLIKMLSSDSKQKNEIPKEIYTPSKESPQISNEYMKERLSPVLTEKIVQPQVQPQVQPKISSLEREARELTKFAVDIS